MKLFPLDDRIAVKLQEEKEQKIGSLYVPDSAKEKSLFGIVAAVGTDEELKDLVKVGDKVIYAQYGGTEIELEGEKYMLLSRADILAKIV